MNTHDTRQSEVLANFQRNTAKHEMEILSNVGLHRHLKFSNDGSSINWFEIITWPGCLCISGDMGTYVFRRVEDMFRFFRSNSGKINAHYWAEKVEAADKCDGLTEFDPATARACILDLVQQITEGREMGVFATEDFLDDVNRDVISALDDGEHAFREAVNNFTYLHNGERIEFSDFWEHNLNVYTRRYLWCCFAIVWGIGQYDAHQAASPAARQGGAA